MSVPKGKRGVSKFEFFHNALKMNKLITLLLVRDFGVKSISKDLKVFTRSAKMNEETSKTFEEICDEYHIGVEAEYPQWLIEYYRNWVLKALRDMMEHIVKANTIYPAEPNIEYWFTMKKKYQKMAQADCYTLLQALTTAGHILPVNYEKFMPFVNMVEKELALLKQWQKSTSKQRKNYYKSIESK